MKKFFSENWPPIALVAGLTMVFSWGFSQGRHFERIKSMAVEGKSEFLVIDPSTPPSKKVTVANVAIAGMADAYFRGGVVCAIEAHKKMVEPFSEKTVFNDSHWIREAYSYWTNINPNDPYIK